MAKKNDSFTLGFLLVLILIFGTIANFVIDHIEVVIVLLVVGGIAAFANYRYKKANPKHPSTDIVYDDDEADYPAPVVYQYWDDIDYRVLVNAQLRIQYANANGETTKRDIDITYYDGSCYLRGYCHLRDDNRTFRIDRVEHCVDRESGENVPDIPAFLRDKYESSPEIHLKLLYKKEKDTLRALYFIGKADGQLRKPEREILHTVVKNLSFKDNLPANEIDRMINNIDLPNMRGFKLAIGRILKNSPDRLNLVVKHGVEIINTQKTTHPSEQEALDYIGKKTGNKIMTA